MGKTQAEFGKLVHFSDTYISAVETGTNPVKVEYCQAVDKAAGTGRLYQGLFRLISIDSAPPWLRPWLTYEENAATLRSFQPLYVPGLLQTEAYAWAALRAGTLTPDQVEEQVAVRLARQAAVLDRERPPLATFVIDEVALRRGGPPELLREQLEHLLTLSERPRVFVHVVPLSTGLYIGQDGPFVLASFDEDLGVAFLEDQLEGRVVVRTKDIAELQRMWDAVRAVALPRDQSRGLIKKLVSEL